VAAQTLARARELNLPVAPLPSCTTSTMPTRCVCWFASLFEEVPFRVWGKQGERRATWTRRELARLLGQRVSEPGSAL